MLHLRVYGSSDKLDEIGKGLEDDGRARHVAMSQGVREGYVLLTAEVDGSSADWVLDYLSAHGVAKEDIALSRLDDVGDIPRGRPVAALIWADVLGQARQNARPVARFLIFMIAAGVIASFGVIYANQVLIVGAMAVSPDILPIAAICTAIVSLRLGLAGRAVVTLVVGLAATCATGALLTFLLNHTGGLPSNFQVGESALSGIVDVNSATIGVALAAGVAGILALETRASSAVGVAISVTTIPAAAYLGVAAGLGEVSKAVGALAVLAVNIAMLVLAGTTTLIIQRRLARDEAPVTSTVR